MAFVEIDAQRIQSQPGPQVRPPIERIEPTRPTLVSPSVALTEPAGQSGWREIRANRPASKGLAQKAWERLLGEDVNDPQEAPRIMLQLAGGVGLGTAGSAMGGAVGGLVGGTTGLILGTVAPEALLEVTEYLGISPPGARDARGLDAEEMRTVLEGEALLEVATLGGLSVLRAGGRAVGQVLTLPSREALRTATDAATRFGVEMLPVQVGNGRLARGFVAVMGRFPWVGSSIQTAGRRAERQMAQAIDGLPERIAPTSSSVGDLSLKIFQDGRNLFKAFQKDIGARYDQVWQRAEEMGVRVSPEATLAKAQDIVARIAAETPTSGVPAATKQLVLDYVQNEILPLLQAPSARPVAQDVLATPPGVTVLAVERGGPTTQTLRQMDGLVESIDDFIARLEPGQKKFAMSLMQQLRQAAQMDVFTNYKGEGAEEVINAMRTLDQEFSTTMATIFETATAKSFGRVRRQGLTGSVMDETTRIPIDQLARAVVRLDSPQAMDELHRLVTPETFNDLTANVLRQSVDLSMRATGEGGQAFNSTAFSKHLGLDKPTGDRFKSVKLMLERSGSVLTMGDLKTLAKAGEMIGSFEIPNVSTFIARRAVMGGRQSLFGAFLPGISAAGGFAAGGIAGAFMSLAMFVGGGKMVSAVISNPASARLLGQALKTEGTDLQRRMALIRALRLGINLSGAQTPGVTEEDMFQALDEAINYLDRLQNETPEE